MKKIKFITAFILLLGLSESCTSETEEIEISPLDEYRKAKVVILQNFEEIRTSIDYGDSSKWFYPGTVFFGNRHYFESISKNNKELEELVNLWDDGLIKDDKTVGMLTIKEDSTIIFTADYHSKLFSGVGHYIIYDPTNTTGGLETTTDEIVSSKDLGQYWKYVIAKNHLD